MRRLAILIPRPGERTYAGVWPQVLAGYRALFAAHGVEVVPVAWGSAAPDGVDAVLPLLAWGYHLREAEWRAMLRRWPASPPLVNPAAALAWNTRKTYLETLSRAGVPVVPTVLARKVDAAVLAAAFRSFQVEELVVKPAMSAGGERTVRVRRGDPPPALADALIQPFLPSILEEGELSVLCFGGAFSHAVRKLPAAGDFRVQAVHGGRAAPCEPGAEALAIARRATRAAPAPLAYARIDLVRSAAGELMVMELEAIEPDLFIRLAPDGGAGLVSAVRNAIGAAPT